ncbi:MAG: hypothetical protein HND47_16035 [Chloroflexi bacterium]|nr:hypothetical protein [Chloroflexota bacterium]
MAIFRKYYSRQGLWTLFLMCALPLHIWTIFLALRDFDWVTARTNSWDAVGVISYGLVYAFVESLAVFIGAALLGFLTPAQWEEKKRIALISVMVVILSLWSIFNQTYFLNETLPPDWLAGFVIRTGRPLAALYAIALALTTVSFAASAYPILKSDKALAVVLEGMGRLALLMTLYLVFDIAAVVIIFVRNF